MNESVRVAFFDAKPYERRAFDALADNFDITLKYFGNRLHLDTAPLADGHAAVCAFINDDLSADVLARLVEGGVKLIALRSAGYNNIDLRAAYEQVHVVRVPAYSPHAIAEHALALMLTLNRHTHRAYYRTRDNNFSIDGLLGFDMKGKTAGVIGTGRIGRAVVEILRGLGMEVLAYDIMPDGDAARELGFDYVEMDELLQGADIVTLHCPLTPENVHMIDADCLARMKDGVMVINTGRGKLIDTQALIGALKSGKVAAAGLDVYEEETEYFFEDFSNSVITDDVLARLLTFPNVLVTSHQGFFTREALHNIARTTLENIQGFFAEDALPNEVCYKCEGPCRRKEQGRCF